MSRNPNLPESGRLASTETLGEEDSSSGASSGSNSDRSRSKSRLDALKGSSSFSVGGGPKASVESTAPVTPAQSSASSDKVTLKDNTIASVQNEPMKFEMTGIPDFKNRGVFQRSSSTDHCIRRSLDTGGQAPAYPHHQHRRQQSYDYVLTSTRYQNIANCSVPGAYFCPHQQPLAKSNPQLTDDFPRGKRSSFGYPPVEVVTAEVKVLSPHCKDISGSLPSSLSDKDSSRPRRCTFSSGIGEASLYHALVVIFLEFFAWGLLTAPMIYVLNETFPNYTFLMNGLIMGIKGILSFLSAPLIGALSDVWGRKFFLLITVFFTCLPIPFMKINTWWYFALISMSGVFAVTYSIVFAYVADVTDEDERSYAYGLVSASFAASLVTSPALGAYLGHVYGDDLVVGLATAIAILDVFFILVAVPESLPEKLRFNNTWSAAHITWENADPFAALWRISSDRKILLISVTVLLSYLPEAGQYSCFFVYLTLVMGFNKGMVATFIAAVGILSVVAQTAVLAILMKKLTCKKVIIVGLVFEMLQLFWYGFGTQIWMMWAAGLLAAMSSITYPAISAYVSIYADVDQQGVVQGIVTGMRGLCAGLGPAMFGVIFYIFHVNLSDVHNEHGFMQGTRTPNITMLGKDTSMMPGPPFVFGALMVIVALLVAAFIPEGTPNTKTRRQSGTSSLDLNYERSHKKKDSLDNASLPLMDESNVL